MRVPRLIEFTAKLLAEHPSIVSVEPFDDPGTFLRPCGLKVTTQDGSVHYLKMTRTSGNAGEDFGQPEPIPYPEYQIPKEKLCLVGAHTVGRSSESAQEIAHPDTRKRELAKPARASGSQRKQ